MTTEECQHTGPCTIVIFGASGDVTRRKLMPALFHLHELGRLPDQFCVVGYGRTAKTDDQFRSEMREGVEKFSRAADKSQVAWDRFAAKLHYVAGAYDTLADLARLNQRLVALSEGKDRQRVYYMALPPSVSEQVLRTLSHPSLKTSGEPRILMEKPFGLDLPGARRLNALLAPLFAEDRIYRVDHFLAKDTVRSLLYFRFANTIYEPMWNHNYIDNIQITAAETIGIEGRGGYYEEAGVVRDMLQNHVLQVLALVTMEPPLAHDVESFRQKRTEVFKALAPIREGDYVLGQYAGYRGERGVQSDSTTPTYAALRTGIENWRWSGVPIYLRSGKAMAQKVTEVVIQFKKLPFCILEQCHGTACTAPPNILVIRIQPDEGMTLRFNIRRPGHEDSLDEASLDFRYTSLSSQPGEAYESVILDALAGNPTLFWRSDEIEAAWKAISPLLENGKALSAGYPNYEMGSPGPAQADDLLQQAGHSWAQSDKVKKPTCAGDDCCQRTSGGDEKSQ